jgi:hypothetical protein
MNPMIMYSEAEYRISRTMFDAILDSLHVRRGKKIVKYATIKDVISYINLNFGLRYRIASLTISG